MTPFGGADRLAARRSDDTANLRARVCPLIDGPFVLEDVSDVSKEDSMQYALLVYERPGAYDGLSAEELEALTAEYLAIRSDERVFDGAHLAPASTATTVRMQDGKSVLTDGPFAETKEVFGGYYLLAADDLDQALAVVQRIPAIRMGGSVEVRPLMELPV
jgi:hypothetical protein